MFPMWGQIPLMFIENTTGEFLKDVLPEVRSFYEKTPFPNYNDFDSIPNFLVKVRKGIFGRLLGEQIPPGSQVLEVGCGTGQLSNFLAATSPIKVYGADMSLSSLKLGAEFAMRSGISDIDFFQMNLFHPCIKPESMDLVISNGVLHHTSDPKEAFFRVSKLVKKNGYIIIGLYNILGRIPTDLRRWVIKIFGEKASILDKYLRSGVSADKKRAWFMDQYKHPRESKHGISEVLKWFQQAGFSFVSSIPKIIGEFEENEKLFERQNPGGEIERFTCQLDLLLAGGKDGGLFIMIGKKDEV